MNGHPITRAEISGYIVNKKSRADRISYIVDDGTGILVCSISVEAETVYMANFTIGDYVTLRGKIKLYHNQREMMINYIVREEDANAESWNRLKTIKLGLTYYQKNS
eukprot:TRINITY_DN723_c0_g1_i2.p1 TRINITY_DN723_c0_g1~~TRINITY_DN723_c0_g1_i2.p1  ORF type:complete len:107 (+),score=8.41 TRINITY_DN723_c0_g1_i2:204-524(+)